MFARYAAIVKNLRGVLVADLDSDYSWRVVEWLVRKFRYRDLGLPPGVVSRHRDRISRYLGGNPFHELVYPVAGLERVAGILGEVLGWPEELAEGLTLASVYISPLMVSGSSYTELLETVSVGEVTVCRPIDDRQAKLHLRIADYSILDSYQQSVDEAVNFIKHLNEGSLEAADRIIEARRGKAAKDRRRYWRILCDTGSTFLLYVDPLVALRKLAKEGPKLGLSEDHAAALALVPAIVLDTILERGSRK